jgi:hypothetical protein
MELSELTDKAVDYIIDALCDQLAMDRPKINDWERNFIICVEDQWRNHRRLSDKQKEILGKIWDKQT